MLAPFRFRIGGSAAQALPYPITVSGTLDPRIRDLADGTFVLRKEDLLRRLSQDLANQIQDHLNRGLLTSTVWLNARREVRQEYLRALLKERIESLVQAYETAELHLDDNARAFLSSEVRALCATWENSEDREMVERMCSFRGEVMTRYWSAVHGDMVHEHQRASVHMRREVARHELLANRATLGAIGAVVQPTTNASGSEKRLAAALERLHLKLGELKRIRDTKSFLGPHSGLDLLKAWREETARVIETLVGRREADGVRGLGVEGTGHTDHEHFDIAYSRAEVFITTLLGRIGQTTVSTMSADQEKEWDVFICHASEDKTEVARPLAIELRKSIRVWLDEGELALGDSLRRKIDEGLTRSRFGVVVLSPDFFRKEWPQSELDALVSREMNGRKVILPILHRMAAVEVGARSGLLAAKVHALWSEGLTSVVAKILRVASPSRVEPARDRVDAETEDSEHQA
jgi:predicted nucleotide-binding protein